MTPPRADELLEHVDWVRSLAAQLVFDGSRRGDLEQEIWCAALRRPPGAGVPLRAWLTGVGRHLAALLQRGDMRRQRHEHTAAARAIDGKSTADVVAEAELQQRLLAAVNSLPDAMRDVVLLRFLEGLPPRAIAQRLQVPVATVRTRLQRALARLREQLDAQFGDRRAWALPFAALPRPRDVAAAAGAFTTFTHLGLAVMNANKLLVAAAALIALAAIPAALWLGQPSWPVSPDFGSTAPVGDLFAAAPPMRDDTPSAAPERTPVPPGDTLFTGRVVDQHGTPIAGATVSLWPDWHAESMRDEGARPSQVASVTAADGTFTFTPLRHDPWGIHVATSHDDHVAISDRTVCRPGEPAAIVMQRVHTVPLTVELHDRRTGEPVPRFRVLGTTALRAPEPPASSANVRTVVIGDPTNRFLNAPDREPGIDGVFRGTARFVEGLPFALSAQCPGDGRDGFGDHTDPIPRTTLQPRPGEPIHVRLTVAFGLAEEHARVVQRGRVVDARTGAPLAGATIGWTRPAKHQHYRYVQSRADGAFTIALPEDGGVAELRVGCDGHQLLGVAPDPAAELTVRLGPLGSLRCRVVDGDGVPVAGVGILIKAERDDEIGLESFQARRRTDAAGVVELTALRARTYHVNVLRRFGDADDHALTSVSYRVRAGEQVDVTLFTAAPDAVRVIGTIVGGPDGLAPAFVPHGGERRWIRARTEGRRYDAGSVPRGPHLVLLLPADDGDRHLPAILLPLVSIAGLGSQALDLLVPAGTVRGRAVTADAGRDHLRVLAVPAELGDGLAADLMRHAKLTDALGAPIGPDGSFEVKHVADGSWLLQLRDGATVVAQRAVTVQGSHDVGDWQIEK